MKRLFTVLALCTVAGLLALVSVAPAFAAGPPFAAATAGLGNALGQVIENTPGNGANPPMDTDIPAGAPGSGTHTAVGRIAYSNPAVDVGLLGGGQ